MIFLIMTVNLFFNQLLAIMNNNEKPNLIIINQIEIVSNKIIMMTD